ncbi:MAG: PadR family transcriptional regulator [Dehalococcoidia bacterium]
MSLSYVILALLSKSPNSGYGLGRLLRTDVSHVWEARLQQIYSELAKLETEGLVKFKSEPLPNRPAKKCYSLTQAGYEELDRWLAQAPSMAPARDELLVRLCCFDRLPRAVIGKRLIEHRELYQERAHDLRQKIARTRPVGPAELGHIVTLESALTQAEAHIVWANRALSLLEDTQYGPEIEELAQRAAAN